MYMYMYMYMYINDMISSVSQVIVHDGVEPVGYGEDGTVGKLSADGLLNEVISLQVHGCRGFIQNQNLGLAQESSSQTHQLTLTHTAHTHTDTHTHTHRDR